MACPAVISLFQELITDSLGPWGVFVTSSVPRQVSDRLSPNPPHPPVGAAGLSRCTTPVGRVVIGVSVM